MRRCLVVVLAALLASVGEARAQDGSLTAFRSDRELARYLQSLHAVPPPPPPAVPTPVQPPTVSSPVQATATYGPVDSLYAEVIGCVTNVQGQPEAAVVVRIESLNAGASTGADGAYRLVIPRARITPGQAVTVTASRVALTPVSRSIVPAPGVRLTQNFQMATSTLALEDLVVTGMGAAESITNTQTEGVDEGGIVKVHGDYLVVLRRGRLFTVDVGGGRLRPVAAVDAFAPGAEPAWYYDELLVSGENVVVIGYGDAGTEINLFRIDTRGGLRHRSTYHMRSNDYYSSENYASRLVNDRLVLYTPVPVPWGEDRLAEWMPALRRWRPGRDEDAEDGFRRTLPATRIYRPGREMEPGGETMLHTITTCRIAAGELDCASSAVLGPWGRVFYVSQQAVYVWVSDWAHGRRPRAASMLYRLPLDGRAPGAVGVEGSPVDQFSFLESGDRHLNVLVRADGGGDGMWGSEWSSGQPRLLRLPLSRFGDGRADAPRAAYRPLPALADERASFTNRFVGTHLLYGSGMGWGRPEDGGSALVAVRWRDGRATELRLPHAADRIEAMGADAVVVGADASDLHFTGIRLDGTPRVGARYVQPGASQGETRSHGFFYRQDGPDEGVIGLPVAGPARPGYEHLFEESAGVLFLRNDDARFRPLGELFAQAKSADEDADGCLTSCNDWYGNSRPIFLRGRVFALLRYEIVEGTETDGRIREVRRASFAPRARTADATR